MGDEPAKSRAWHRLLAFAALSVPLAPAAAPRGPARFGVAREAAARLLEALPEETAIGPRALGALHRDLGAKPHPHAREWHWDVEPEAPEATSPGSAGAEAPPAE